MRSASVNLAGTGSAGSRGGWKWRKVALRVMGSALVLAASYPSRSLMHPHTLPGARAGVRCGFSCSVHLP